MGIVESKITSLIFHPPPFENKMEMLEKRAKFLKTKTRNNETVHLCMIYPKKYESNYQRKYILFSYGNGSDLNQLFEYGESVANRHNVVFILYDYIGYGYSRINTEEQWYSSFSQTYDPTEERCYQSLEAVIDLLTNQLRIDSSNIILVGNSLGTGIVIDYASKNIFWETPIVLISPYKSILSVISDHSSNIMNYLFSSMDKFQSYEKITNVMCPIKFYHGVNDGIIYIEHSVTLYNSLKNPTIEPTWITDVGHNNILPRIDYEEILKYVKNNC